MFIQLGSRKVFVSPSTYHPDETWARQQARNVVMWLEDEGAICNLSVHDRDTKFTEAFDEAFKRGGAEIVRTPYQSPIANAFAESWIGSLERECLNHFACFSLGHLDHIVQTYTRYYNSVRPHQSLENAPLDQAGQPPPEEIVREIGTVHQHELLGGLLNHYERKAA